MIILYWSELKYYYLKCYSNYNAIIVNMQLQFSLLTFQLAILF
jgi:hypothetical protein